MWLMSFLMTEAPEIAATGALHHKCVKHVVMRLQRIVGVSCFVCECVDACSFVLQVEVLVGKVCFFVRPCLCALSRARPQENLQRPGQVPAVPRCAVQRPHHRVAVPAAVVPSAVLNH